MSDEPVTRRVDWGDVLGAVGFLFLAMCFGALAIHGMVTGVVSFPLRGPGNTIDVDGQGVPTAIAFSVLMSLICVLMIFQDRRRVWINLAIGGAAVFAVILLLMTILLEIT